MALPEEAIKQLIEEMRQLSATETSKPHDYASLRQRVLQLELRDELDHLDTLLITPNTLEANFKERCNQRANGNVPSIGFEQLPMSQTNQLYWDIANALLKPKTMQGMLTIIAPNVQKQLQISLQADLSGPMKQAAQEGFKSELTLRPDLSALNEAPNLRYFAHYLITRDTILDIRDIKNFPFRTHVKLKSALEKNHCALATQLYRHNQMFRMLESDAVNFINEGISPKAAMKTLIMGLTLGGERMTGSEYANHAATIAISIFMSFFESMPQEQQDKLEKAQGSHGNLKSVIDNELKKGTCVETAALHLTSILETNENQPWFNQPAKMSKEGLKRLEKKYKKINTQKDDQGQIIFPDAHLKTAIKSIAPRNSFELVSLIMNFPPSLYGVLIQNIHLAKPDKALSTISDLIKRKFLTNEQVDALAEAVISYYKMLNPKGSVIYWAVETGVGSYLTKVLEIIPEQNRLNALQVQNKYGNTPLKLAAEKNPEALKIILGFFQKENQLIFAQIKNKDGSTLLHQAANNSESMKIILKLFPQQDRLKALQVENKYHNMPLHYVATNPASLRTVLELLPEEHRPNAARTTNSEGETLLHEAARTPESLEIILALIPKKDWPEVVLAKDKRGNTPIKNAAYNSESLKIILGLFQEENRSEIAPLEEAVSTPDSLKIILGLFPEKNRLEALQVKNDVISLLSEAVQIPESLKLILELFPKERRLKTLQERNTFGDTLLSSAVSTPASLKTIFELLPENDILEALQTRDKYEDTLVYTAAIYPMSVKIILDYLSEKERLKVAQTQDSFGTTLLHNAAQQPNLLKFILELFPKESRIEAVQMKNERGDTPLSRAKSTPESLKIIFELLPEKDRLNAALTKVKDGCTLLNETVDKPESLEAILEHFSEKNRLNVVQTKDESGHMLLRKAVCTPESLKIIFKLLPEEDKLKAILTDEIEGITLLHLAAFANAKSLELILKHLSQQDQQRLIHSKSQKEVTPLHLAAAAKKPVSLEIILGLMLKEDRPKAIRIADKEGNTPLHYAALVKKSTSLKVMLELLTKEEQIKAIREKNKKGDTVLHCAAATQNGEALISMLEILQQKDIWEAVLEKNNDDKSVLDFVQHSYSNELSAAIEKLLPEKSKKATLEVKSVPKNLLLTTNQQPNEPISQDQLRLSSSYQLTLDQLRQAILSKGGFGFGSFFGLKNQSRKMGWLEAFKVDQNDLKGSLIALLDIASQPRETAFGTAKKFETTTWTAAVEFISEHSRQFAEILRFHELPKNVNELGRLLRTTVENQHQVSLATTHEKPLNQK